MSLSNFFSINLPYGLFKNKKGEWMAFNREYLPLGYNDYDYKGDLEYVFEKIPIHTKYKRLTDKFLINFISFNGENGVKKDDKGEVIKVYLYNQNSNPVSNPSDQNWEMYLNKLKRLSKLEVSIK